MSVGKSAALAAGMMLCASAPALAAVQIEAMVPAAVLRATSITGNTHLAGDTRLFLTAKNGSVVAYDMATSSFSTLQDLSARVTSEDYDERGLLGLTFDPGYATNGQYYVYMTGPTAPAGPVMAQVLRFTDPAITGAPSTETTIWTMDLDGATTHIGGWIDFDQSGKLLISVGDGGVFWEPDIRHTGQNPGDWFGSILRIDPHGDAFPDDPALNYAIPADNPAIAGGAAEVYVYGLRNPFRNSIAPDGNLILADVGHDDREEVTIVEPGNPNRNLGWALREGDIPTPIGGGPPPADYQAPDLVYDHSEGQSIIGGFVYRGSAVPELFGRYVFGDEMTGNLWSIGYQDGQFVGSKTLIGNIPFLVSFGETMEGEIVMAQYDQWGNGGMYRLTSDGVGAAVPEPASWAMAIAGLALVGGTMRRRGMAQAARLAV